MPTIIAADAVRPWAGGGRVVVASGAAWRSRGVSSRRCGVAGWAPTHVRASSLGAHGGRQFPGESVYPRATGVGPVHAAEHERAGLTARPDQEVAATDHRAARSIACRDATHRRARQRRQHRRPAVKPYPAGSAAAGPAGSHRPCAARTWPPHTTAIATHGPVQRATAPGNAPRRCCAPPPTFGHDRRDHGQRQRTTRSGRRQADQRPARARAPTRGRVIAAAGRERLGPTTSPTAWERASSRATSAASARLRASSCAVSAASARLRASSRATSAASARLRASSRAASAASVRAMASPRRLDRLHRLTASSRAERGRRERGRLVRAALRRAGRQADDGQRHARRGDDVVAAPPSWRARPRSRGARPGWRAAGAEFDLRRDGELARASRAPPHRSARRQPNRARRSGATGQTAGGEQ